MRIAGGVSSKQILGFLMPAPLKIPKFVSQ
jgi:hypothetical protein